MPTGSRRLFVVSTVAFLACAVFIAADSRGIRRWRALGDDVERLETANARLRGETEVLQRRADALRGDPRALERAARENGYVRGDEILFELK